jgi:hypothetical protein
VAATRRDDPLAQPAIFDDAQGRPLQHLRNESLHRAAATTSLSPTTT